MGSPDWHILSWTCCSQGRWLPGKTTITSVMYFGRDEVLRRLRHWLWTQNEGHYTFDHRCSKRKCLMIFLEKMIKTIIIQMNIGNVSDATLGKLMRDKVEHIWAQIYYLELNWIKLNCSQLKWDLFVFNYENVIPHHFPCLHCVHLFFFLSWDCNCIITWLSECILAGSCDCGFLKFILCLFTARWY